MKVIQLNLELQEEINRTRVKIQVLFIPSDHEADLAGHLEFVFVKRKKF